MHKKLIIEAFNKAEASRKKRGEKNPSLQILAEDISEFGSTTKKFELGERRFRDYHSEAKKLEDTQKDINIKQFEVINGLCEYLGFVDYQEFETSINNKKETALRSLAALIKKNRITVIAMTIVAAIILVITTVNKQRWMVWKDNHYIEVKFDANEFRKGNLKMYREERIGHFEKIIPNCKTKFFKDDGNENLWYGKNIEGKLEYFTDLAKHPETGKTLKPITKYMIRKYICETYQ